MRNSEVTAEMVLHFKDILKDFLMNADSFHLCALHLISKWPDILRGGPNRYHWHQGTHARSLSACSQRPEVPGAFEKIEKTLQQNESLIPLLQHLCMDGRSHLGGSTLSCP